MQAKGCLRRSSDGPAFIDIALNRRTPRHRRPRAVVGHCHQRFPTLSHLYPISGCSCAERKADVVFVPGLGGDALRTWRFGRDASSSWPHWLGEEFPTIGVWSLDYAASPTKWTRFFRLPFAPNRNAGYSVALPRRALQVLDLMVQKGVGERPLMFICHSLGGLLAKHILRAADETDGDPARKQVATNTRAVLFLATPHSGAPLASFISAFRNILGATVTIEELRAHDAYLEEIGNWYRRSCIRLGIQTVTYYELRPIKGIMPIVSSSSAHAGVGTDPIGLDEDHLSIAKPRERDAQVCSAVRRLLNTHGLGIDLMPLREGGVQPNSRRIADSLAYAADLRRLLAELDTTQNAVVSDPRLQRVLCTLIEENQRLRDENERLKVIDTARQELQSKIEVVREFLSKREIP